MPHTPPSLRFLAAAAASSLLLAAGCLMQPSFSAKISTADGQEIEAPLGQKNLDIGDGAVEVVRFQYTPFVFPDKTRGILMSFEADLKGGARPSSIVIVDVTEAPIIPIYASKAVPVLKDGHRWLAATEPDHITEARYHFLENLDNSVRVYRFTFTMADGSIHVLWVPIFVPGEMKGFMRKQMETPGVNP
jgi:hypothetical protein